MKRLTRRVMAYSLTHCKNWDWKTRRVSRAQQEAKMNMAMNGIEGPQPHQERGRSGFCFLPLSLYYFLLFCFLFCSVFFSFERLSGSLKTQLSQVETDKKTESMIRISLLEISSDGESSAIPSSDIEYETQRNTIISSWKLKIWLSIKSEIIKTLSSICFI